MAYRSEFLVWALTTNMPLVMLALWTEVAREAPIAGFGDKDLVAYFLLTLIVRLLTGNWVVWEMNNEIRQGDLAMRLLRPIHPFIVYGTDNVSPRSRSAPSSRSPSSSSGSSGSGAVTCRRPTSRTGSSRSSAIFGAWAVIFCAMLVVGSLGLFWESSLALVDLWLGLFFVFSGYLMPLAFFPGWLRSLSWWLPFRYTLAFPVETMLGLESMAQALRSLVVQWAYVAGLLGLALVLWRRGLARYAVYGG